MQLEVNNKIYEIRKPKKPNSNDEFLLYHANNFVCIFYQDGRSMDVAINKAIEFVSSCEKIKDINKNVKKRRKKFNKRRK